MQNHKFIPCNKSLKGKGSYVFKSVTILMLTVFSFIITSCPDANDNGSETIDNTINEQLRRLQENAESNGSYLIPISSDESISPKTFSYTDRSNITITLSGGASTNNVVSLNLSENGSLFTVGSGVTLILYNVILNGIASNNSPLVNIQENGTLIMRTGSKIYGNTSIYSTGGVGVSGTFIMEGGEISGNTTNGNAGGVFTRIKS